MLSLFIFILQVQASDTIVLYPGASETISIPRHSPVQIEKSGIIKVIDHGSKLKLIGQKIGSTKIMTSAQNINIHVVEKKSYVTYQHLKDWIKNKRGPNIKVVDNKIVLIGKLLAFFDWLELKEYMSWEDDFLVDAKTNEQIQKKINNYLKDFSQNNNLPFSLLTISPFWQVSLSDSQKTHLQDFKKLLSPYGIQIIHSAHTLSSEPMIEVNILAAEVRRHELEQIGIDWPNTVQASLVPQLDFGANSVLVSAKLFEQKGLGKVLASPTLLAKSGETATFHSGGEIPIKSFSRFASQIQWKKYGIMLTIKPTADYSGKMVIEIDCEVSAIDNSTQVDGVPGMLTNKITSKFNLNEIKTIALSGLIKEEWSENRQGLPGLIEIPLLKKLFSSESFEKHQSELFFFVTPKIIY